MAYSPEQIAHFEVDFHKALHDLQESMVAGIRLAQTVSADRVREYLQQGVCRRLKILRQCLQNVFNKFPPTLDTRLNMDDLTDVQIQLHAFVINLFGILDNLAWAFVIRHDLEAVIGGRQRIGLFLPRTYAHFSQAVQDLLLSAEIQRWYSEYLKNYRDALAHRIPLYVPPAVLTRDEGNRFQQLEQEIAESLQRHEWDRLDELRREQDSLGSVCLTFIHSYSADEGGRHVYLHPQMIADAQMVVQVCRALMTDFGQHG